ncbi:MAG: hypothetical protein NUW06_04325 [Candidatus Acetothermia bacterium]|jgi:hypothetical protein|nr:hypothetical protein [Candidatus Acetothermia bacterium]MDH7505174.1 hypothetical protein [Candidatus Acetothermia bacterium]
MPGRLLALALAISLAGAGSGAATDAQPSYGLAVEWLVHAQTYSFFGLSARAELERGRVGARLELGLASNPGGDDLVLSAAASAILYLGSGPERPYFGLGLGWARWEDLVGWDRGVWEQSYSKLLAGSKLSLGLPLFWEVALTVGSWFNPVLTVGLRL